MRVTVLVENTSENELVCEHGLSLFIETGDKKILLDAGSTDAFAGNAKALSVDLASVDFAVLSHGHYDHSGGFSAFFVQNYHAKLYASKEVTGDYYSGNGGLHPIGVPAKVLAHRERFVFVTGNTQLAEGIWLVGHSTEGLSEIGKRTKLYKKVDDAMLPDNFAHEQSLVIDTPNGLVIFNSCSHGGAANIIREAKFFCNGRPVYAYVCGLHMKGRVDGREICTFSEKKIDALCQTIRDEKLSKIYTGHCTGLLGLQKLQERLGDTAMPLTTGLQFEL